MPTGQKDDTCVSVSPCIFCLTLTEAVTPHPKAASADLEGYNEQKLQPARPQPRPPPPAASARHTCVCLGGRASERGHSLRSPGVTETRRQRSRELGEEETGRGGLWKYWGNALLEWWEISALRRVCRGPLTNEGPVWLFSLEAEEKQK